MTALKVWKIRCIFCRDQTAPYIPPCPPMVPLWVRMGPFFMPLIYPLCICCTCYSLSVIGRFLCFLCFLRCTCCVYAIPDISVTSACHAPHDMAVIFLLSPCQWYSRYDMLSLFWRHTFLILTFDWGWTCIPTVSHYPTQYCVEFWLYAKSKTTLI